jgi:hypothetical protein
MQAKRRNIWLILLLWALVCIAPSTLALYIGDAVADAQPHNLRVTEYLWPGLFLSSLLLMFCGQYFVLWSADHRVGAWVFLTLAGILVSIGGWLSIVVLMDWLMPRGWRYRPSPFWSFVQVHGIPIWISLCIGIGQWFALRKVFQRSGWWIAASTIAWASEFYVRDDFIHLLSWGFLSWSETLFGARYALVTGIALFWLLLKPLPNQPVAVPPEKERQNKNFMSDAAAIFSLHIIVSFFVCMVTFAFVMDTVSSP